jgi:hypothetical protein
MNNLVNAQTAIEEIMENRWRPSTEHSALGLIYLLQGNIDDAQRELKCALEFSYNHSLQDKLNRIYLQCLLGLPGSEKELQIVLANLQPPYSLLEQTILSPVKILSRTSMQIEEINRLVRFIHQYKDKG